jgi:hypothetical protein
MNIRRGPQKSLVAEYNAAIERERAEWKVASDASLGAVERVKAYARWLSAAERTKALSHQINGEDGAPAQAAP